MPKFWSDAIILVSVLWLYRLLRISSAVVKNSSWSCGVSFGGLYKQLIVKVISFSLMSAHMCSELSAGKFFLCLKIKFSDMYIRQPPPWRPFNILSLLNGSWYPCIVTIWLGTVSSSLDSVIHGTDTFRVWHTDCYILTLVDSSTDTKKIINWKETERTDGNGQKQTETGRNRQRRT